MTVNTTKRGLSSGKLVARGTIGRAVQGLVRPRQGSGRDLRGC